MSAWKAGKIQWFDETSEEGMIVDLKDGTPYYVHISAVDKKKIKKMSKGKEVKFKLYENLYSKQVEDVMDC